MSEIPLDLHPLPQHIGVFDLETTGVDVTTARIVTAHLGVLDADGEVLEATDWLADPGIPIPEAAAAVHGITTERAQAEGRPSAEVTAEVLTALAALLAAGTPVVIYNAPYDLSILKHEAARHGLSPLSRPRPIIDPLVIDKAVDRYRKGKRTLEAACAHYGVTLSGAHEASADAIAAGRVALALLRGFPNELGVPLEELQQLQERWHEQQAASFEEYMRSRVDDAFRADRGWPVR